MTEQTEDDEINPLLMTPEGHWHPDLERRVKEAIQRYPNMDADWWVGPAAALRVVADWLREASR